MCIYVFCILNILFSPLASKTSLYQVLNDLLQSAVGDALNEFAYPASLAGLGYGLTATLYGLEVLKLDKRRNEIEFSIKSSTNIGSYVNYLPFSRFMLRVTINVLEFYWKKFWDT